MSSSELSVYAEAHVSENTVSALDVETSANAVAAGAAGVVVHGPKGDKGDKGDDGERGPQGPQGPQGPKGNDGTMSFDELTPEQRESLRGPQGLQGEAGTAGPQGERGPQGPQGDTGPAGHTPTDAELTALIAPIVAAQLGVVENGAY